MTTATTVTLPATGREIPAELARFAVTSLKQMNTYDGVAVNATLRYDGKIIGNLEDDGRGGGTYLYPRTAEARAAWEAAIAATPDWTETHDGFTLTYTAEHGLKGEAIAEWLIAEYEEARWLNREAKKGTVIRRTDGQHVGYNTTDETRVAKAEGVAEITVWTAQGWVTR